MVYNMTEKHGESFTKVVFKKAGRAKERLLQNFGKADRTTDNLFELYEHNFAKQQNSALRLQKEIKSYVTCIRSMQIASKNLMDCLSDIYEPDWPGHDKIPFNAQNLETLWEELCTKLNDQVTIPLVTYLSQFSEIKAKIDKRGRKLVDYDSTRHALEAVQKNPKKKDEMKLARLRDDMEGARRLYDVLNKELHDELPNLYDSRIPFLISILQTLFATQTAFFGQCSRTQSELNNYIDELAIEAQKGTFHINARLLANNFNLELLNSTNTRNLDTNKILHNNIVIPDQLNNYNLSNNQTMLDNNGSTLKLMSTTGNTNLPTTPVLQNMSGNMYDAQQENVKINANNVSKENNSVITTITSNNSSNVSNQNNLLNTITSQTKHNNTSSTLNENISNGNLNNKNNFDVEINDIQNNGVTKHNTHINNMNGQENFSYKNTNENNLIEIVTSSTNNLNSSTTIISSNLQNGIHSNNKKNEQEVKINPYEIPVNASTDSLPPGVHYKVKATYKYAAEDDDELEFDVGEIIYVIDFDNVEEQEEGWLMGCKQSTGERGLFPANFTIPI